eukprot:CAMPEP_0114999696 /NCGR_PEP_ID=MMETSP0216-20121206/16304_1 /TAXON_ID=223996 /ORGANISM="Protocruzia adherens, Strain Boccale" /LENGTH=131 /DNA_ID=CAMNT_0002364629 /DNA_START=557 /DNA_END=949 /DNA_ORIENTATION=+
MYQKRALKLQKAMKKSAKGRTKSSRDPKKILSKGKYGTTSSQYLFKQREPKKSKTLNFRKIQHGSKTPHGPTELPDRDQEEHTQTTTIFPEFSTQNSQSDLQKQNNMNRWVSKRSSTIKRSRTTMNSLVPQ